MMPESTAHVVSRLNSELRAPAPPPLPSPRSNEPTPNTLLDINQCIS